MGTREEQKSKRREEILMAGLELFIRRGYAATKIKDIAESVGMSVGLLFHYFETKERLYEELIRLGVSGPMGMMAQADLEPLDFFKRTTEQILHIIKADPFVAKMFVLMHQANYNEAAPQSVKDLLMSLDVMTPSTALMKQGQANGTIREGDPFALAIAYWCTIQGIAEQVALVPEAPCPESDWLVDMIRRKCE